MVVRVGRRRCLTTAAAGSSDRQGSSEMALKNLDDLFTHMLRDTYYAEKQLLKALPKMARKAESAELREAFEQHAQETEGHIENLEKIFEMRELKPRGVTCEAMNGMIEEAKEIMDEIEDKNALDAGMIAAAQAVEHYEISRYGTMIAWANQLGLKDAVPLLQQTLEQEKATDEKLTMLAEGGGNQRAAQAA
jgi:ferritin-like metal-binding protein YciE